MTRFSRLTVLMAVVVVAASAVPSFSTADETKPTASTTFDGKTRPDHWGVNFGHWEPQDGVLVCRENKADEHAAASRWKIPMSDGIVTFKLRMKDAKAFHVGFDPARGELDKKGHLYSLIITPAQAMIKRHKDKANADSSDLVLGSVGPTPSDEWIDVRLETRGNVVTAKVGDGLRLEVTDPTFHVRKPTVVFRVAGGEAHLDDVTVTVLKP